MCHLNFSKIFIVTPPGYVTGGVEAIFQFCDAINSQGGDCYLVFSNYHPNPIPDEYKRYKIKIGAIENSFENLLIVPEIWPHLLDDPRFNSITKAIWWLSIDNAVGRHSLDYSKDIIHFYQSYYAESFLEEKKVQKKFPLFDYISEDYFTERDLGDKKNIICYSIKGEQLANSLKPLLPEYDFVMLKGMTREEVIQTLMRSKVFIDFGSHPGKDRIPREAAILGNCVITNKRGSANFVKDVGILEKYKIENEETDKIVDIIKDCIENYETRIGDFQEYRNTIISQKEEFFEQTKTLIK